jgi:chromosome segregation ATPase
MANENKKFVVSPEYPNGILVDMTPAEIAQRNADLAEMPTAFDKAMEDLRAKRNNLLKETDHYALSDQTLSDDMRTYRQSLRDLTEGLTTVADVEAVVFPTKPA